LRETPGFSNSTFKELWDLVLALLRPLPVDRPHALEAVENSFVGMLSSCSSQGNEMTVRTPIHSPIDAITLSSRVYSFLALGKTKLAIRQLFDLQRGFPWSREIPKLTRKVIHQKNALYLLRKLFWVDISHPSRLLAGLAFFGCMAGTLSLALSFQELITALVLMSFLTVESYINARTLVTLNSITYSGIVVGLISSITLDVFAQPVLAGSGNESLSAALLSLVAVLGINYVFVRAYQHKDDIGLGAGTVKLIVMVATFVGFRIIPIMLLTVCLLAVQGFLIHRVARIRGELKWSQGRVCPAGYGRDIEIPVSTSLLVAVWITLLWPLWMELLAR
jgi:hypothetical protein